MRLSGAEKIGLALTLIFGFGGGVTMINDPHNYVSALGYALMVISSLGMCVLAWHHFSVPNNGKTKIRLTREEKRLAKLGWIHLESKYVDLKDAITKINDETKAGEIAFPNPFGKKEIDELQVQHIWQMLKNLGEASVIKIYYLHSSSAYKTQFRAIDSAAIQGFSLIVTDFHFWLSHENNAISVTIKIDPADLEKAISQIRSEIKIATKNQITNPPTLPPLIQAPQLPQSKT